jgi:hypothetical protein
MLSTAIAPLELFHQNVIAVSLVECPLHSSLAVASG